MHPDCLKRFANWHSSFQGLHDIFRHLSIEVFSPVLFKTFDSCPLDVAIMREFNPILADYSTNIHHAFFMLPDGIAVAERPFGIPCLHRGRYLGRQRAEAQSLAVFNVSGFDVFSMFILVQCLLFASSS